MSNLKSAIDQLGDIKAQIADLKIRETALKNVLIEQGAGSYEGDRYRVTVSICDRETLDMEAVRAKLTPQFIRAHTIVNEEVATVTVKARTGAAVSSSKKRRAA